MGHCTVNCAKTAEPIDMPLYMKIGVDQRNHVLDGVQMPQGEGAIFGGCPRHSKALAIFAAAVAAKWIIQSPITPCSKPSEYATAFRRLKYPLKVYANFTFRYNSTNPTRRYPTSLKYLQRFHLYLWEQNGRGAKPQILRIASKSNAYSLYPCIPLQKFMKIP